MVSPGDCYNGCCRSNPCQNGGTCVEQCQSPKEKIACQCPQGFIGNICETAVFSSCKDVMTRNTNAQKGKYLIRRTDNQKLFKVICLFNRNTNRTWTLIESFSFENNKDFKSKSFYEDNRVNQDEPNWASYRLGLNEMQYLRSNSKMFRATCDVEKKNNSFLVDSIQGVLEKTDIFTSSGTGECLTFAKINIRGKECLEITLVFIIQSILSLHAVQNQLLPHSGG